MVLDRKNALWQRLDKAAKILDLLGDIPRALQVLQANLDDPEIHNHRPILLETLVFLADIHAHLGKAKEARRHILKAQNLDMDGIDPDQVAASRNKLERIREELDRI